MKPCRYCRVKNINCDFSRIGRAFFGERQVAKNSQHPSREAKFFNAQFHTTIRANYLHVRTSAWKHCVWQCAYDTRRLSKDRTKNYTKPITETQSKTKTFNIDFNNSIMAFCFLYALATACTRCAPQRNVVLPSLSPARSRLPSLVGPLHAVH